MMYRMNSNPVVTVSQFILTILFILSMLETG